MANFSQVQSQVQIQTLSQRQIQAINMLAMSSKDLRKEIYNAVQENPALEIVKDPLPKENYSKRQSSQIDMQAVLESNEDRPETLQQHLMSQLNMMHLSSDEYSVCQKLIYNLDKNGCYGSMLAPETLLDRTRPAQNKTLLDKCISLIQKMDPVGVCCKTPEESLYIQAKVAGDAPELALFLLDNHLEMLNPPVPSKVLKQVKNFQIEYHKKSFSKKLIIDDIDLTEEDVSEALQYILHLNPHPAGDFISDTSSVDFEQPDVVLTVTKEKGLLFEDDFGNGKICGNGDYYFQVKYASGILPELKVSDSINFDKEIIAQAKAFISNVDFCKSTLVLQGCAIVKAQKDFFEKGEGFLAPLTRRKIAQMLDVHESTISRTSSKKNSKFIQTEWGIFPASYFFTSGVKSNGGEKVSSKVIIAKIQELILNKGENLSDNQLTKLLNDEGIKIARRTVNKYRQQAGINNSYKR